MVVGVKIEDAGAKEGLGQQYISPEDAVLVRGADVIIVGRGITHSSDQVPQLSIYSGDMNNWLVFLYGKIVSNYAAIMRNS